MTTDEFIAALRRRDRLHEQIRQLRNDLRIPMEAAKEVRLRQQLTALEKEKQEVDRAIDAETAAKEVTA